MIPASLGNSRIQKELILSELSRGSYMLLQGSVHRVFYSHNRRYLRGSTFILLILRFENTAKLMYQNPTATSFTFNCVI